MIEEIYHLGNVLMKKEGVDPIGVFMDLAKLKNTKKVLCITFKIKNNEVDYLGVEMEDYDEGRAQRYLYKRGSSRGTDIMPTSLIAGSLSKTFQNKILKWFENECDDEFLKRVYEEISSKKDIIEKDLNEKYESIPKEEKRNILLTVKFRKGEKDKYLGDYKKFKEILIEKSKMKYYFLTSMGESKGNGRCYLCGKEREVYGFVLPAFGFSFSTADKRGFVGDLKRSNRWKEVPICEECAMILELGKGYLDKRLSFNFYGNKYYVIPSVVFEESYEDILTEFIDAISNYPSKEYHEGLIEEEDYIPELAMERGNIIKLIFMFYKLKPGGGYIDILKYVENVLPSHLKKIYDVQKKIRSSSVFSENLVKVLFGKKEVGTFVEFDLRKTKISQGKNNWYIAFSRRFFTNKEFLEFVGGILSGKVIERKYLIARFLNVIRQEFRNKNDYGFKLRVIESLMIYDFLQEMGLLRGDKMEQIGESKAKFSVEKVEEFFKERNKTFGHIEARASFLVGTLVNYLLYVQRDERGLGFGDEPFRSKLYGLSLDEKKVKKIFTSAVEKLSEYKRSTPLERVVADYLSKAGNGWKLSKDDISYYFALGMVMGTYLFMEKEKNGGE